MQEFSKLNEAIENNARFIDQLQGSIKQDIKNDPDKYISKNIAATDEQKVHRRYRNILLLLIFTSLFLTASSGFFTYLFVFVSLVVIIIGLAWGVIREKHLIDNYSVPIKEIFKLPTKHKNDKKI